MGNLIWASSKCYPWVGSDFGYYVANVSDTDTLMYFAELSPNTTYTIQRIDTSTRMRIGIGSKYNDYYFSTISILGTFTQYAAFDDSQPHTFATGANEDFICIYLSNSGETGIRVQLNEGNTIEPYSEPTIQPVQYYKWHINGDYPVNMVSPDIVDQIANPIIKNRWTFKSSDDGYPIRSQFIQTVPYCLPVKVTDEIVIYDMNETVFSHFGLRILAPTSCIITEELNGMYELEMEHPIDDDGIWKMILDFNIVKANGQLFRIYRKIKQMSADGTKSVKINARHIFYDLNDRLLIDVRPTNLDGYSAIQCILNNDYKLAGETGYYSFSGTSDIMATNTSYFENMSVTSALIGADNCFLNRWGGELHRDNFHFSINSRMENSVDNAFNITYGVDMFAVEETIDYSDFCSCLIATDNYENGSDIWYTGTSLFPHHIVKKIVFSYDDPATAMQQLYTDSKNYFDQHCVPQINYTVSFANLKKCVGYEDFQQLQHCNVGDTGYIYNEQLDITTLQKIIKKTYNVLTQSVESVELGNMRSSLTRPQSYSNTVSTGTSVTDKLNQQLQEINKKNVGTSIANMQQYTIAELQQFTIAELEGI